MCYGFWFFNSVFLFQWLLQQDGFPQGRLGTNWTLCGEGIHSNPMLIKREQTKPTLGCIYGF